MQQILEELKKGSMRIVDFFAQSDRKWGELLKDIDSVSVESLAEKISFAQAGFEGICGKDRSLGKTIMAWSAFAHLYSCAVGFEDNGPRAYKLSQAFEKSRCSLEVKATAQKAAEDYGVRDFGGR